MEREKRREIIRMLGEKLSKSCHGCTTIILIIFSRGHNTNTTIEIERQKMASLPRDRTSILSDVVNEPTNSTSLVSNHWST